MLLHYSAAWLLLTALDIQHSSTPGILITIGVMAVLFAVFISACVRRRGRSVCGVKLCAAPAKFAHTIPGHGRVEVCARHSNRIKNIVQSRMKLDRDLKALLNAARDDLQRAQGYDPANEQIRKNLQSVRDMIAGSN
jgi:hypothetical protein